MTNTPIVVGIAGGTASGKSTLTQLLAHALGDRCTLIVHDRYYKTLPDEFRGRAAAYNFDHPDALDTAKLVEDLDQLRAGRPADLPDYDFKGHVRGSVTERVHPREFVVVEGILVLADPRLRERFDRTVYVDTDDDVRLIRRLRRDVAMRGRTFDQVLEQYERTVRPMHKAFVEPSQAHAELVLDGTVALESNLGRLQDMLGVSLSDLS